MEASVAHPSSVHEAIPQSDLLRRAMVEVIKLPDPELLALLEVIEALKRAKTQTDRAARVAWITTEAKRRAEQLRSLPREEVIAAFRVTSERMRQQALESGTAVNDDWTGE